VKVNADLVPESYMHAEPKELLKQAVQNCLPILQGLAGRYTAPYQVWKKTGEGQWHGEVVPRPDMRQVFIAADREIKEAGERFAESFTAHCPEYNGMVGFSLFRFNIGHDRTYIFRSALGHLWRQHETFDLGETSVDDLVNEFESFVDTPTVRFLFRAQLLNFKTSRDTIDLPEGLRIRRMSEKEVSVFHGGSLETLGMIRSAAFGPHEFCIEGEMDNPKVFGDIDDDEQHVEDRVKAILDRGILCLRTFKEGHVGYDYVHFFPVTFCPVPVPSYGYGDLYMPFGSYTVNAEEIGPLVKHAKLIFGVTDAAMEMACSRLADAEHRTRPKDCVVDAVIGMEALLLAGIEDRRGELNFRFSLNYAMLFPPDQRQHAYRLARDLYGLRSVIAHGSPIDEAKLKIAGEKMVLPEVAKRATSALRTIIMHFLPKKDFPYKNSEFWQRAYFGISEPS
jgi:hypothetical protein